MLQHYVSNKGAFSYVTYFQGIPTLYLPYTRIPYIGRVSRQLRGKFVALCSYLETNNGQFLEPFLRPQANPWLFSSHDFQSIATLQYLHIFVT
jgi:hypothetical protein